MPEGPEVRVVANKIAKTLPGRMITNFYKDDKAKTIGFNNLKCPVTIIEVRSHGKKIIIDIDTGHMIITSLGMTGRFQYVAGNHSHIRLDISDYKISGRFKIMKFAFSLYLDDYRNMGGMDIIPNAGIPLYFRDIGPDLLQLALDQNTWIPLATWTAIFTQNKLLKRMICDVLIDQSLIAGLGNYLRCEILYYSAIHPERLVKDITQEEWDRIRTVSHKIISLSYAYGGLTVQDFISPDGELGLYPKVVYKEQYDPVGNPVIKTKIKGKHIHWVPAIQK